MNNNKQIKSFINLLHWEIRLTISIPCQSFNINRTKKVHPRRQWNFVEPMEKKSRSRGEEKLREEGTAVDHTRDIQDP